MQEPAPSTAPTPRAATTVGSRTAGPARPEAAGTGSADSHCHAVAAGLADTTPAPLPPGAANEASAAAEHACLVNAPGRTASGSASPGKGNSAVRTTAPVPLPGSTHDG